MSLNEYGEIDQQIIAFPWFYIIVQNKHLLWIVLIHDFGSFLVQVGQICSAALYVNPQPLHIFTQPIRPVLII